MQGKIGESVIVVGRATKDAEFKLVGEKNSPVCSFSLAVGKRKDTTTIFANCKAWYKWAEVAKNIKKGDDVLVIGHTESREYNGNTYTDLIAEWINVVGAYASASETSPSGKPYPDGVTFEEELSNSEEKLPF